MSNVLADPAYVGDLGGGLRCRWSTVADSEKVGLLLSNVHRDSADEPPVVRSLELARIFMNGNFPYMNPGDFAVVEDINKPDRPIVACTCLWRHEWSYADIRFPIGRPEYVATDPEYRNRGLIRSLFEMIHARSAAEGHLLQAITGIAYFYRLFGYEYVLDLEGNRTVHFSAIPEKPNSDPEPYQLRPATLADIPTLMHLYQEQRENSLLWYEADEAYWRFIIGYWDNPVVNATDPTTLPIKGRYFMLVNRENVAIGATWAMTRRWGRPLYATPLLALRTLENRQTVVDSLLRLLRQLGMQTPAVKADSPACSEVIIGLGIQHPLYELLGEKLALRVERPYAWYVRVPDLPAFLRHIAPVLQARLAASVLAGFTGDLKIDLYRSGLFLRFEQGKVTQVEAWRPPIWGNEAMAGAPPLLFLQLLLCYRSLDELRSFFPDVWANDQAKLLIEILFPKLTSNVFEPLE